mgnify:CR=1 FL=1
MAPEKQERGRVDNREVINDVLVNLFNEILRLEEEAIITDKYKDISNNDMHIIEAVGLGGGNMSSIAAKLKITVGSLTTSMNSLVNEVKRTGEWYLSSLPTRDVWHITIMRNFTDR